MSSDQCRRLSEKPGPLSSSRGLLRLFLLALQRRGCSNAPATALKPIGDGEHQDLRVRQLGLGLLAGRLVHEQECRAEHEADEPPRNAPSPAPTVLEPGDVGADQHNQAEDEVGDLVDA